MKILETFRLKLSCQLWISILMISASVLMTPLHIYAQTEGTNGIESFSVSVVFNNCGIKNFNALYSEDGAVYLPVTEIFDYLKIFEKQDVSGGKINGYFVLESQKYEINYQTLHVYFNGVQYTLKSSDLINDNGQIFMRKELFEKIFKFHIDFDFRSLSAKVGADFEFPLARMQAIEKARSNIGKTHTSEIADTIINRQFHWFKAGMADWSLTTNTLFKYDSEVRGGLGFGAELLGGEANLLLNYSNHEKFSRNMQRYNWRWVDNNFKIARQIQAGRIYSKSVSSMLYPLDGIVITNSSTTVRKTLGNYVIADHTNPDWIVELYINKVLTEYVKADASGFYHFTVPIVYGSNQITLRFYGPNGEEWALEKELFMPYNILPKGEFEYRVTGGSELDSLHSKFARAEVNYGLTRWLTVGGGYEYLSSIPGNKDIPFGNLTFQPLTRLIITGEYAYGVRTKANLNYNFKGSTLNLDYTYYHPGQKAIIYNYREERLANIIVPLRFKTFSLTSRAGIRQNIFENFDFNTGELSFSGYYNGLNVNIENMFNWSNFGTSNFLTNFTVGIRCLKNLTIRPSIQYNYSLSKIMSFKLETEKQVIKNGYLAVNYENNPVQNYSSLNLSFRYDFSFMSSYLSTFLNKTSPQIASSFRGSVAFGNGGNTLTDSHEMVGRSGLTFIAFVDENQNGKKDQGEPAYPKLNVRCNGGKLIYSKTDSLAHIIGIEPFVEQIVTIDESNFDYISWKVLKKNIKVIVDPNQFKKIYVAIQPMCEITGMIIDQETGAGKSRMLINITDSENKVVAHILSESDGYFSYMGLKPGNYTVGTDSEQLNVLNLKCTSVPVTLVPSYQGDSKDVGNLMLEKIVKK